MPVTDVVYIGQVPWSVVESDTIEDFGETDSMGARLLIRADQHPDQKRDTLLHELLHSLVFTYGIPMGDAESEEVIIKSLTPVLLDVLASNPKLVERLVTPAWKNDKL